MLSSDRHQTTAGLLDLPLPTALDSERLLLGAPLTNQEVFQSIAALVEAQDFSLEKHRRIFLRLTDLFERGDSLNTLTLVEELRNHGELESVDGITYLAQLTGVPQLVPSVLEHACRLVREKAILRRAIGAGSALLQRCYASTDAPADLLVDAERITEMLTSAGKRKLAARTVLEVINDEGGINSFLRPDARPGIHIPFDCLNHTLQGLRRSKLIILGARPATGKTALAVQLGEYAAHNGNTTLLVSLEMKAREVLHRSITGRAQVSAYKFRCGELSEVERFHVLQQTTQLSELEHRFLLVDSDTSVPAISALLRTLESRRISVNLCIVDYLQLLSSVGSSENRVQEVSLISRGLKAIARTYDIPVLALSQLSRQKDKGAEPQLDWLKESGQLEQDSDQVVFLWLKKDPEEGDAAREVHWKVAKNRDGILNRGTLTFSTRFCRFVEDGAPAPPIPVYRPNGHLRAEQHP